jgi:hypothetical protein
LGISGSTDGASSCAQNGPASPACATSDGGNGNGGTGAPGGAGGDSIGGDGGGGGDVFGGTGTDGASAYETTDSCFNDNGPESISKTVTERKNETNSLSFFISWYL